MFVKNIERNENVCPLLKEKNLVLRRKCKFQNKNVNENQQKICDLKANNTNLRSFRDETQSDLLE